MNPFSLTLEEATAELSEFLPDGREAFRLNAACERLLAKGKYRGFTARARFIIREDRQITLPMDFETMIGATLEDAPLRLRDPWYEFMPKGSSSQQGRWLPSRDLGDGFVTFRDPGTDSALRLSSEQDETVEFWGLSGRRVDDEGADAERFESEGSFTGPATVLVSGVVSDLTGFQKARTDGRVYLEAEQANGSWLRVGCYEPRDTKISLRRYSLPSAKEGDVVSALCKRRFRKAELPQDPLAVDSIYALRTSLEALSFEEAGEPDDAAKFWALAIRHLDDQLSEHRGSAGRSVPIFVRGAAAKGLRAVR